MKRQIGIARHRRAPAFHGALLGAAFVGFCVLACRSTATPTPQELLDRAASNLEAAVQEVVDDPARRGLALDAVREYVAAERAFLADALEIRERGTALHRDHGATREAYAEVVTALEERRRRFVGSVTASWAALDDALEPDEIARVAELQRKESLSWLTLVD
jgi:hypothetical protein